jgi:hypothetical protein
MPSAQKVDDDESEDGGGHYLDKTAQMIRPNDFGCPPENFAIDTVARHEGA